MKFSELPARRKHAWLYMAAFLMMGFILLPTQITDAAMQALIAGVCFGAAAMTALFMLGKKPADEVK